MSSFLEQFTAENFRNTIINVTRQGIEEISSYLEFETFEHAIMSESDEVITEINWALSNVVEVVVHEYLAFKGLVDVGEWDVEYTHHNSCYSEDELSGCSSIKYHAGTLKAINTDVIIVGEFNITMDDFYSDVVVNECIVGIANEVEKTLAKHATPHPVKVEHTITLYSLKDEPTFITVRTDLVESDIKKLMVNYHSNNKDNHDVADFSYSMTELSKEKGFVWVELADNALDYDYTLNEKEGF